MFRRFLLPLLFITITSAALAQTGTISGVVKDAKTEEVVVGANVILQGTSVGAMTDVNGAYTIPNVKPGTYNLVISFVTYKSHIVPDVLVEDAKITNIAVAMVEDAQQLEEVVVQGTREINTDL